MSDAITITNNTGSNIRIVGKYCDGCHQIKPECKWCSKCRTVMYCSRNCQSRAWKEHKLICEDAKNITAVVQIARREIKRFLSVNAHMHLVTAAAFIAREKKQWIKVLIETDTTTENRDIWIVPLEELKIPFDKRVPDDDTKLIVPIYYLINGELHGGFSHFNLDQGKLCLSLFSESIGVLDYLHNPIYVSSSDTYSDIDLTLDGKKWERFRIALHS